MTKLIQQISGIYFCHNKNLINRIVMKSFILILVFLVPNLTNGQITKFKKYGTEQGICNNQVYDIKQDINGFIWLGTGEGLCRYDGFNFSANGSDTIVQAAVSKMFLDSRKNIWIGYENGVVLKYDGYNFTKILNGNEINNNSIVAFSELKDKVVIVSQNSGIVLIDDKLSIEIISQTFNQFYITAFEKIDDENILIGSFDGLFAVDIHDLMNPEIKYGIKGLDYIKVQAIKPLNNNTFIIGTEDMGLYELNAGMDTALNINADCKLKNENIQDIYFDSSGNIWLSTFGSGVIRLNYNYNTNEIISVKKYDDKNGLGANDIKSVFEDIEGNIWVGTYNQGLACLTDEAFLFYDFSNQNFNKNIVAIASYKNVNWYASGEGILKETDGLEKEYKYYRNILPNDRITALHFDGKELWIGTASNGLYTLKENGTVSLEYLDNNSLSKSINHITGSHDSIWVSTKNGAYLLLNGAGKPVNFSTNTGLGHNNINAIYVDNNNNAWIATKSSGLKYIDPELRLHSIFAEYISEVEYMSIQKDSAGNIWSATSGFGVLMFSQDTIISFLASNGLKSNYCYSLNLDKNKNIWVGHRMGISKINTENYSVKSYSSEEGIVGDCNQNALIKNNSGELIFGTTEGIIIYNPEKDKKKLLKPLINFVSVRISYGDKDKVYPLNKDIKLPYNKYNIRIDFIGLSYKSPESIQYQYKLDGYDEWSDLSEMRYARYGKITDGNYTFMVKACNAESLCNETPIMLNISVRKPFWKMWWFFIMSVLILIVIFILIIKIRERKQKAFQDYLQKNLDERTREVVKQKEEIEIKNRDITDSINYAQRIQHSILPSIKTLQTYFSGSFVYYQPRDIVSGDFYWFGLTKNNKFIIVCADSTGHGVPGAFMSMIGTILIKDICAREDVTKPSDILSRLDNELSNTLNQNLEAERSNDGMDIIVCEIDIKTYYTRIASAMRPVIVYQNGQQIYVKGSRNSVGGHIQKEEKIFENEGFQLAKGDLVYMFSDGYPDQFGGPMEKKFKMVRLKNLLKDIYQKPMDEQYSQVKNTFVIWKEGLEQVDDVLFMGIKI